MRKILSSLTIACLAVLHTSPGHAYSVQPMVYTLTPSGSGSTARLTISNTRGSLLNVEIQPFSVTADASGKAKLQAGGR